MTFSTDTLRNIFKDQNGIARSNRYSIFLPQIGGVPKPAGGSAKDIVSRRDLGTLCTSAKMPGKNIAVAERVIGIEQIKVANGYTVDDMNLTFYLTNDYSARRYFQEWMDCVISPTPPYTAGFHENYARDGLVISQMDNMQNTVYSVELLKAFPTSMVEIDLNNQAQSGATEMTVALSYSNYLVK